MGELCHARFWLVTECSFARLMSTMQKATKTRKAESQSEIWRLLNPCQYPSNDYLTTEYLFSQMKQDPSFQLLSQRPLIRKHTYNYININIIHFVSLIKFLGLVTIAMVPSRILAIAKSQNLIRKRYSHINIKVELLAFKQNKYLFIFISINIFY